jgi:quercetin dioxygenase-like cupin family protein
MCEVLDKLEKLTPQLPSIPRLYTYRNNLEDITFYKFSNGVATSQSLHSEDDITIAKTYIKAGVIFDVHSHDISGEWLIVLCGILEVTIEDNVTVLEKYDSIKIESYKPHSAKALTDTTIITITIPKDDGFPE